MALFGYSGNGITSLVWVNRRAKYLYQAELTKEAGIALLGAEVKSVRANGVSMTSAYAVALHGEIWVHNLQISQYQHSRAEHDVNRPKKLLLHRREMNKLAGLSMQPRYSLIPMKIYFNDRGWLKVEIGLCVGLSKVDKREKEKKAELRRELREL